MSFFRFLIFLQIFISPIAVKSQNVWPDRVIPYVVDTSIKNDPKQFYSLLTAKAVLENKSCLTFVPRKKEKSYVRFSNLGNSPCWNFFDKTSGSVPVNVGSSCLKPFLDTDYSKAQIFSDCDLDFLNELYGCRNHILKSSKSEDCPPSQWTHFRRYRKNLSRNNSSPWRIPKGPVTPRRPTSPKGSVTPRRPNLPKVSPITRGQVKNQIIKEDRVATGNCSSACRYNGILTPLYQAFNEELMVVNHFYTEDKLEQSQMLAKNYIKEPNLGYIGKSPFDSSCKCLKPLYRLHNDFFQDTMLTAEEAEKDRATTLLGYKLDRVIGYCTSEPGCGAYLPLYRLFNFIIKDHMYTTDQKEMQYHKTHPTTGYGLERIECFIWQFSVSTKACEE